MSPAPRWIRHTVSAALVALLVPFGCGKQGEGERCDAQRSGNTDCEPGLECVDGANLLGSDEADRCCPSPAESSGACRRIGSGSSTGGSTGSGGTSGGAGSSGDGGASGAAGSAGSAGQAGGPAAGGSSGGGAGGNGGSSAGAAGSAGASAGAGGGG